MPGIVGSPTVVEEAVAEFGGLFANAPERRHFGAYLTGLMVLEWLQDRPSTRYSAYGWQAKNTSKSMTNLFPLKASVHFMGFPFSF